MKAATSLLLGAACFGLGLFVSCQEQLPSYQDPRYVLKGLLHGRYVFSGIANSVALDFEIVNTFDETFQAKGVLRGEIQLTLRRKPGVMKTLPVGPSDLATGNYDFATQVLTMDPGDTIRFTVAWDYTDDSFRDLRQTEFFYVTDPQCSARQISLEEVFDLRGTMKVYDKVNDVSAGPAEFDLCHVSTWVDPKVCISIRPEEACKFLP